VLAYIYHTYLSEYNFNANLHYPVFSRIFSQRLFYPSISEKA